MRCWLQMLKSPALTTCSRKLGLHKAIRHKYHSLQIRAFEHKQLPALGRSAQTVACLLLPGGTLCCDICNLDSSRMCDTLQGLDNLWPGLVWNHLWDCSRSPEAKVTRLVICSCSEVTAMAPQIPVQACNNKVARSLKQPQGPITSFQCLSHRLKFAADSVDRKTAYPWRRSSRCCRIGQGCQQHPCPC